MVITEYFGNRGLEQDSCGKLWDVLSHICNHIATFILFAR